MQATAHIRIAGEPTPFDLDFDSKRWSSKQLPEECDFPLVAEIDGKRYELYSDKTFAEVEM
ncbi:MAG TPA: hypothetical protein VK760_11840 [Candidatus Acidoferrales bacterium]|jgi:hypothetical protein|nr:hypothetical protein [Candidatus Acidoferrales bacterium]